MPGDWFEDVAAQIRARLKTPGPRAIEFVAGIRVNGAPHIGTYFTLASAVVFAARAAHVFRIPCAVRVHFLDNDPTPDPAVHGTHFHCVYQTRTPLEGADFIRNNYGWFLDELTGLTGCACRSDTYSACQEEPEFRSAVLRSLTEWKNIKYYISGPPLPDRPAGVRGLGFPCPECGLYNARNRPAVELLNSESAIVGSECCIHGEYNTELTPRSGAFLNLETTYRNVIKEIMALKNQECLIVMMKGVDWRNWLPNVDLVLSFLGVSKGEGPPRFLLPVVQTEHGIKLSKSVITHSADEYRGVPPRLLDMKILRQEVGDCSSKILRMAERILDSPAFVQGQVLTAEVMRALE